jgi:hypothetical protein
VARNDNGISRPDRHFDEGLQHERTALAWERTAISTMVAGVLLGRYGAEDAHFTIALVGCAAGRHRRHLAGVGRVPLRRPPRPAPGGSVGGPSRCRAHRSGFATVIFTGFALLLALMLTFVD